MPISVSAKAIGVDSDRTCGALAAGCAPGVPLVWFPHLRDAALENRATVTIRLAELHWNALEENISAAALPSGHGNGTQAPSHAA